LSKVLSETYMEKKRICFLKEVSEMKKLILVLAITLMIASQSFGALSVYLDRVGTDTAPALVDIKYSGADANIASEMPRAFAFRIKVNNTAYVDDVTNFKIGESNTVSKGFGIYPATIVIDSAGTITNNGTPIASSSDPSPGAIDTNNVVLEFASLYWGQPNAPPSSGTLCRLSITKGTASGSSTVTLADEDTYRGGLVFEDGSQGDTSDSEVIVWATAPGQATTPYPTDGAINVNRSTTVLTWVAGSGATSRDVFFSTANPPLTKVISDGTVLSYNPGTMTGNKNYYWRVDEKNSVGTTTGVQWTFKTICKGDYNASSDITTADISALVTYWNANKNAFGQAPLTGPGYVVGMDITGDGKITTADISQLVTYWNANKNAFGKAPCMP